MGRISSPVRKREIGAPCLGEIAKCVIPSEIARKGIQAKARRMQFFGGSDFQKCAKVKIIYKSKGRAERMGAQRRVGFRRLPINTA